MKWIVIRAHSEPTVTNVYASAESGIKTKLLITTVSHKRCGTMPNLSKGLGCGEIIVTKPGSDRNLNLKIY